MAYELHLEDDGPKPQGRLEVRAIVSMQGDSEHTPAAAVIECYLDRPRSPQTIAEIDSIFFASSATTHFADDAVRAQFRERWLGRYIKHWPELAFLALASPDTGAQQAVGYIVGSLDDPAQSAMFDDLGYFKELAHVTAKFPAQLHVNLDPRWRGQGTGSELVAAFAGEVRRRGAPGVHAITTRGMRNLEFYKRCGFTEEGYCDWQGRQIVLLARALA